STSASIQAFTCQIQDEDLDINEERNNLSLIGLFLGHMAPMPLMVSIIRHKYELHGSLRVFPLDFGLF
ncbi:hypothetical protein LINGRAHAP2_LOCUS24319, partial [Linum grandiflorum]